MLFKRNKSLHLQILQLHEISRFTGSKRAVRLRECGIIMTDICIDGFAFNQALVTGDKLILPLNNNLMTKTQQALTNKLFKPLNECTLLCTTLT